MYAVLLAAMMTGGGQQAEAWGWRHSCSGCYGSCYGSCYGGSCHGCSGCHGSHSQVHYYGGSCSGCCGGSCYGGCSGSCYGCNGFTGYSVGYTYWASGCYGSSCFGGCYGCQGGIGCYGWGGGVVTSGVVNAPVYGGVEYGGTYGGSYNAPIVGTVAPPTSGSPAPAPIAPPPINTKQGDKGLPDIAPPPGKGNENAINTTSPRSIATVSANNSTSTARVVIFAPADAKLWVDNVVCPLTGDTRSFNTPSLQPGAQYAYTLTLETNDGKRENRRVTMTAGRTVEVDFRPAAIDTVAR